MADGETLSIGRHEVTWTDVPHLYFSAARNVSSLIEKLAALRPQVLACMHGQAWEGDGAALLRALGDALASPGRAG